MPDIRGKPLRGRAKRTAVKKAESKEKSLKAQLDSAKDAVNNAQKSLRKYEKLAKSAKTSTQRSKYERMAKTSKKNVKASKKRYDRLKAKHKKANTKSKKLTTKKGDMSAIKSRIEEQRNKWTNEGKMALYRTDGVGSAIFFAPTETESESNQTNVTSWAVDKGAPRSSYARVSSKTISLSGLITGETQAEALEKWRQLRSWHSNHNELTFQGDIYYKHFIMSQLDRQYTGLKDNIEVTMTLTFVRAAEITTSKGKTSKKKKSKSSKTTTDSRNKNYTAITIKGGDTLYKLSKKYGKSVKWLAKVNKIKDPNKIIAGKKIRVK